MIFDVLRISHRCVPWRKVWNTRYAQQREGEPENRALAGFRLDPYPTSVRLDQSAAHHQPQARAFGVVRLAIREALERFEQPGLRPG